jgi:hypothetical protein
LIAVPDTGTGSCGSRNETIDKWLSARLKAQLNNHLIIINTDMWNGILN